MAYCHICGEKLPDGAKFCISCGTPVFSNAQTPPTAAHQSGRVPTPPKMSVPQRYYSAPASTQTPPASTQTPPASTQTPPASTRTAPAPTQTAPAPTRTAPAPTQTAPAPTQTAPAPTQTAPAPTQTAPAPTQTAQAPTRTAPAPTQTAPAPTQTAPPTPPQSAPSAGSSYTQPHIKSNERLIKGLICVPIAAALIFGITKFFEIDLSNMDGYANTVADKIREFGIFTDAAPELGKIAVYGLAVMIVLSAYMLPARLSKAIYKTCSVSDKMKVTLAGYFVIALSIYLKKEIIDTGITGSSFSLLFRVHGTDRLKVLLAILILLLCIGVALAFIIGSSGILISVVLNNIHVNGPILGIIAAAYELLSSVFVTALVLCAFSFGVAIILMPFLILAACSSGKRVVYDQYGNMYYVAY